MNSIRKQIINDLESKKILDIIDDIYRENWSDRHRIAEELASLHNDGMLNIISEVLDYNTTDGAIQVFSIIDIFHDALPYIKSPPTAVMQCLNHLAILAENNKEIVPTTFTDFCSAAHNDPDEIIKIAVHDSENLAHFILPAIIAGSKNNLKYYFKICSDLLLLNNSDVKPYAILALGLVDYGEDLESADSAIKQLNKSIQNEEEDRIRSSILKSAYSIYKKNPKQQETATLLLDTILKNPEKKTLLSALHLFMRIEHDFPEELIDIFLQSFYEINTDDTEIIKAIDFGLAALLRINQGEKALDLIESIFLKKKKTFPLHRLDALSYEIVKNKNNILNWALTKYLSSDAVESSRFIIEIINNNLDENSDVRFDTSQTKGFSPDKYLLLAKRTCGWLFSKPVAAMKLIISIADSSPEIVTSKIEDILFNPILISYPGSCSDLLNSLPDNTTLKIKNIAGNLLAKLNNHHENFKSANAINELRPSLENIETYNRQFSKKMKESYKNESNKLTLHKVFGDPLILLYGDSTIDYVYKQSNEPPFRQETRLHSIKTSVEFPSLFSLDPHNLELTLISFKYYGYN
jgi:hypothetical protein